MIFKRIVFFGSIQSAKNCLKIVRKNLEFQKIIIVTETRKKKYFYVRKYAKKNKLMFVSYNYFENNFNNQKFDLGIAIRYNNIFKEQLIKRFKFGIINLHGGELPFYRGTNNHIFAIINNEKKFGVSLHIIKKKIDSGRILAVRKFKINKKFTGYALLKRTFSNGEVLLNNFTKNLAKMKKFPKGKFNNIKKGKEYKHKDLDNLKKNLKLIKNKEILNLTKRALYHPNKNEI